MRIKGKYMFDHGLPHDFKTRADYLSVALLQKRKVWVLLWNSPIAKIYV